MSAAFRVILSGKENLTTQAHAAEQAMISQPNAKPGTIIGIKTYGLFFGVKWNKGSVSVYPQKREPQP